MTNPERAELDILRAEKSKWEALREEDRAEKTRLLQELNDLRSQVPKPQSISPSPERDPRDQGRGTRTDLFCVERRDGGKSHPRSPPTKS